MSDKRVDLGHEIVQVGWRIRSSGALFQSGNDGTDEVFASAPESYEPVFIVTESDDDDVAKGRLIVDANLLSDAAPGPGIVWGDES